MKNNTPKIPKNSSTNDDLWKQEIKKLERRLKALSSKGIKVDYKITKPEKVTKRDIEQIKAIGHKRILGGVSNRQVKIKTHIPNYREKAPTEKLQSETLTSTPNSLTLSDIEDSIVKQVAKDEGISEEEARLNRENAALDIELANDSAKAEYEKEKRQSEWEKFEEKRKQSPKVSSAEKEEQWKAYWRMKSADPNFDPDDSILNLLGREAMWDYVDGKPQIKESLTDTTINQAEATPTDSEPDEQIIVEETGEEYQPKSLTYYVDSETGEYHTSYDMDIYMRDDRGKLLLDENGKPMINPQFIEVKTEPLSKEEYEEMSMQMLRDRYSNLKYSRDDESAKRGALVSDFIDKLLQKYSAAEVRRAFEKAAEEGYEIGYADIYVPNSENLAYKLGRIAKDLGEEAEQIFSEISEQLMSEDEADENWEDIF